MSQRWKEHTIINNNKLSPLLLISHHFCSLLPTSLYSSPLLLTSPISPHFSSLLPNSPNFPLFSSFVRTNLGLKHTLNPPTCFTSKLLLISPHFSPLPLFSYSALTFWPYDSRCYGLFAGNCLSLRDHLCEYMKTSKLTSVLYPRDPILDTFLFISECIFQLIFNHRIIKFRIKQQVNALEIYDIFKLYYLLCLFLFIILYHFIF